MPSATRKALANQASAQTTSGNGVSVLAGKLNLDAEMPTISGRGRPRTEADPETLDFIRQMLKAGRGTVTTPEFASLKGPNGQASYKLRVERAAEVVSAEVNYTVGISWVTIEGSLGSPAVTANGNRKAREAKPARFPLVQVWSPFNKDAEVDATK